MNESIGMRLFVVRMSFTRWNVEHVWRIVNEEFYITVIYFRHLNEKNF